MPESLGGTRSHRDSSTLFKIRFEVRHCRGTLDEVRVILDDIDFIERGRHFELPLATAEGRPSIAGAYSGLGSVVRLLPASPTRRSCRLAWVQGSLAL